MWWCCYGGDGFPAAVVAVAVVAIVVISLVVAAASAVGCGVPAAAADVPPSQD